MGSAINKRQQIRNERALQDLIKTVPGNDRCADCAARNPGWASWSLGIFLCMRCAAIHRKLGTHISKVKSLSMDAWTSDQVENMKRTGNAASSRLFNPRNVKPAIPIDVDEVDGVMERFIRQKYDSKTLSSESQPASRQHTGSTGSFDERTAATLPPKPSKRFTFSLRSSSSAFPLSRSDRSPPLSPGLDSFGSATRRPSPPGKKNKPSKIFGTDIGGSRQDNYELKLIALREMGFPDDKRNLQILKGESGNVDRAAATLLRLGESSTSRLSSAGSSPAPETPPKDNPAATPQLSKASNPFDRLDLQDKALPPPPPVDDTPQRPHSSLANPNAYNPFLPPSQPTVEQSFQGLSVAQPAQLFPNTTGGYSFIHPQITTNPFLQTYTPPPQPQSLGSHNGPFASPAPFAPAFQALDRVQPSVEGMNPFLSASHPSQYQSQSVFEARREQLPAFALAAQPTAFDAKHQAPFTPPTHFGPSFSSTIHPSPFAAHNTPSPVYTHSPQQMFASSNPFLANTTSQAHSSTAQMQYTQTGAVQPPSMQFPVQSRNQGNPFDAHALNYRHSQTLPAPARVDKASILALYNLPSTNAPPAAPTPLDMNTQPQATAGARRSITMPLPSTRQPTAPLAAPATNPFAGISNSALSASDPGAAGSVAPKPGFSSAFAHISHESVDFSTMLNGRHSPDAFAGLSARIAR